MFISNSTKHFINKAILLLLFVSLVACGGGGTIPPNNATLTTINGTAQKGAFLKDSIVSAYQLNEDAIREGAITTAKVTDSLGTFSINPSWDGWTEVSITGRFFDEDSGANSATEITLNSITKVENGISNVNLFTHFIVARLRYLLAVDGSNITIDQAYNQAQIDLKSVMSLSSNHSEKLDIFDGEGLLKNDNAILLLFSGGFMSNNGNATSLLTLSNDFANNGKIDDEGSGFFQDIANYAGSSNNLGKLSNNLKQAGIDNPPSEDDLIVFPKWINNAPVATISPKGKTIEKGRRITMDATTSQDPEGGALTYSWSGDGTEDCGTQALCVLENLRVGNHSITLTAYDEELNLSSVTALINVVPAGDSNSIPLARVQPSIQTVKKGLSALFDASNSSDGDGDTLSYDWSGLGTENCGNDETCSINGLDVGVYYITVIVNDDEGGRNSVFARLTVTDSNIAPEANAGIDQTVTVDRRVELSGDGTDSDGTVVSYEWLQGAIPIGTTKIITVSDLAIGEYEYTLAVTDNDGATTIDKIIVTVVATENVSPEAYAGRNQVITQGQSVFLVGTGTDSDGTIESYQWFEGQILLGETANISIPSLSVGTHHISLVVTDNKGGNDTDSVTISVNSLNVTVDVSSSGCIVRLGGRFFSVDLALKGGETGTGTTVVQEYEGAECTGERIGSERSFPTTYTITNIQTLPTDASKTTADMEVSNFAGRDVRKVTIVDGKVVLPTN